MILHLLLFTAFVLWYADFEAKDDAQEIAQHKRIDHSAQWLTRAAVFGSGWYLLWVLTGKPSTWPVLIGHAFLFPAVFRYRLNKRRGVDARYVSPSSWYDLMFLRLHGWFKKNDREERDEYHRRFYEFPGQPGTFYHMIIEGLYTQGVHRAGTTAYCVELTLFALSTAGAVAMQMKS